MPANPNWARWIFASVADYLKQVALDNAIAVIVEGNDERDKAFMQSSDRAEIRVTGPYAQEISHGCFRLWVDVNVLLTSRMDGAQKNAYTLQTNAGLFQEAMDHTISVYRFGTGADDDQSHLGCLSPRSGKNDSVRVIHFGQVNETDKLRQAAVDARYVMYLNDD